MLGIDASAEIKNIISQKKIDPKKNVVKEINAILKRIYFRVNGTLRKKRFF